MIEIPDKLIKSLTKLGILESEAKIYTALVFLQSAEVRDLLEFLDLSKPSIYEGLKMLEKNGLIILTNPRPATYQAIEPEIALKMIIERYNDAQKEALIQFQTFKNQEISVEPTSPVWFVFGGKSLELKIKDMLKNAKESISCHTSVKYLDYIEKIARKNIQIQLAVTADDNDTKRRVEYLSKRSNVTINIIEKDQTLIGKELKKRSMESMMDQIDLDNQFMLVVDDLEVLFVPPLKDDYLTGMTSTNKALLLSYKIAIENALFS